MSPQESRTLWCLLKDDPVPYYVMDIPIDAKVTQLKGTIQHTIESLHDTSAYRLKLFKLNKIVPIDPDHSLEKRFLDETKDAQFLTELSSGNTVGELFLEQPSDKHLHVHVMVQCHTPASLKRSLSSTEEDGRATKHKRIGRDASDIQARCLAIHKAIRDMPDHLDLSDPLTFTDFPFPSPLKIPSQRFQYTKKETSDVFLFKYMGRSQFHALWNRIKCQDFLLALESLYLYGTSGSGKSHLLAALVYQLVRGGQRVFYIPDCSQLVLDPAETMWDAYHFAYGHSPNLRTIESIETLIKSMKNDPDIYVIVDQVNALENTRVTKKDRILDWFDILRSRHRYIFSASANENSNRDAEKKQSAISVFPIFGGMSPDETNQWFKWHCSQIPQLSYEQRQRVEYLTGCIPLLLRCLCNLKSPTFVESEFRNISDLRNVNLNVDTFARKKIEALQPLSKKAYLEMMATCVRGDTAAVEDRSLYDLRHFYFDAERTGHFTCGIAFEAMISVLRRQDTASFLDDFWYRAVERSNNPVVRGFLAEQICLSHIAANGLMAVDTKLGPMRTATFDEQPNFEPFLSSDQKICLYIPTAYNFRSVDGAILLLDRASKQATMFPLQFTLSQNHAQSDKTFHTNLWSTWIKPIVSAGFRVSSTFVWIDEKRPSKDVESELVKIYRSGNKVVHPEYSVVHVGVETVDPKLGSALGIQL